MRKNELIKLLQNIKGNPEVVLWNGLVEDYHHISKEIVKFELVKETEEHVRYALFADDGITPTEKEVSDAMKQREWGEPNPYITEEQYNRWYGKNKKTIYVLQGNLRGKSAYDRLGSISY